MSERRPVADDFLALGPKIRVLPIVHGSGDFAVAARDELLSRPYDCLAVPLPAAFQDDVEAAVERLPGISVVVRRDASATGRFENGFSYVPIDPCQGVVASIRTAIGERIPREFIDLDSTDYFATHAVFPDPYALKRVGPAAFAAAVLPGLEPPAPGLAVDRIHHMAARLRELERRYDSILCLLSLQEWPWVREAYRTNTPAPEAEPSYAPVQTFRVDPRTLIFLLGELPFVTALYERGRRELTDDQNLSVDGVKEMAIAARERLRGTLPRAAKRITPHALAVFFRYVRNLSLMDRRLTPDLYTLVVAARQTAGDDFALALAETARDYPFDTPAEDFEGPLEPLRMSDGKAEIPGWGFAEMATRLPGVEMIWRSIEIRPNPPEREKKQWKQRWDPYGMCSWPPEDDRIESFHRHVRDQAKTMLGADLARSEKFTSSVMDGIDIRETLRNWHTGDLYVKVVPPGRGSVEAVVFLFETPADPVKFNNRATWYAEHPGESTLAFYATDPLDKMVGPGIAQAEYGGALFLYPPRPVPDIWEDSRLDRFDTVEERMIAGACLHSRERHVALVCPGAPSLRWRRIAKRYGRKLVHLPLSRFGAQTIERLRRFHILNGKHIRSFASDFIRDA